MAEFQPPPTYADVVLIDERTKKAVFNPIWLKWFIDLSANLGPGGAGTVTSVAMSGGTTGLTTAGGPITTSGTFTLGGTLIAANGGTGFASYAVGDLVYAGTTTTLAKLADIATGNVLISGGVSTAPSWGKIALTTHVSGILPVANGGTGVTSSTGSTNNVLSDSPTLVTPTMSAPVFTTKMAATYIWTSWNPPDVVGNYGNAPATAASSFNDTIYFTFSNSSGTLTITCVKAGCYLLTITVGCQNANTYTLEDLKATLGGTATVYRVGSTETGAGGVGSANWKSSEVVGVIATAGQTVTILPAGRVVGAGITTNYALGAGCTIAYYGG